MERVLQTQEALPLDLSDSEIQQLADVIVEEIRGLGRRRVSKRKILEIVEVNLRSRLKT